MTPDQSTTMTARMMDAVREGTGLMVVTPMHGQLLIALTSTTAWCRPIIGSPIAWAISMLVRPIIRQRW
jgi:hypothetical protein